MKKGVILVLALLLLFQSCCLAEGIRISVSFGKEAEMMTADFFLTVQERTFQLFSSLCPKWVFQAKLNPFGNDPGITDFSGLTEPIRKTWEEWSRIIGKTSEKGVFTGDLFETAEVRDVIRFGWSEIQMLLAVAESQDWPDSMEYSLADLFREIRSILTETAMSIPGLRFELELYPEAGSACFTAFCENDTVGTFSIKHENASLEILIGYAENGKTYYRTLVFVVGETKKMNIATRVLADDRGNGYKNLPPDAEIYREEIIIEPVDSDQIQLYYTFVSGKDRTPFLTAEGTLGKSDTGFGQLNLEVRYGSDTEPFVRIQAENESAEIPEGAKIIDLLHSDEETLQDAQRQLKDAGQEWMIRLFQVLPAEMVLKLLNNSD